MTRGSWRTGTPESCRRPEPCGWGSATSVCGVADPNERREDEGGPAPVNATTPDRTSSPREFETRPGLPVGYGAEMNGSLLNEAFGHHVWATLEVLDVCARLDEDQLATTVPGTFGTIIDTLRHTVGADVSYLTVFDQGGPAFEDEETADIPAMRTAMEAMSAAWERLLATELDPMTPVTRQ